MASVVLLTSGCGIIPKPVEFGQDKVAKFPVATAKAREAQRQAAALAAKKAGEVVVIAVAEDCSTNLLTPAVEAADLSAAVSTSLGPPLQAAPDAGSAVEKLNTQTAKLNERVREFAEDNDVNAGKKIEGTGWFQVPYFVWLGIVMVFGFVGLLVIAFGWALLKAFALASPPAALGVNAVALGGRVLSKGFAQLIKGGEEFKSQVEKQFDSGTAEKVLALFREQHERKQDSDVQAAVQALTK